MLCRGELHSSRTSPLTLALRLCSKATAIACDVTDWDAQVRMFVGPASRLRRSPLSELTSPAAHAETCYLDIRGRRRRCRQRRNWRARERPVPEPETGCRRRSDGELQALFSSHPCAVLLDQTDDYAYS